MSDYENRLQREFHNYLVQKGVVDERLQSTVDIEERWQTVAASYIPDGIKEFQNYPEASLGWMMYTGMALAHLWDEDWKLYSSIAEPYLYLKSKRGYDRMDEYIREEVLHLQADDYVNVEELVGACASFVYSFLRHQGIEPGTVAAFNAYVDSLHQMYIMGAAIEFKRLGYSMQKVDSIYS